MMSKRIAVLLVTVVICVAIVMGSQGNERKAPVNLGAMPAAAAAPLLRQPAAYGINLSPPAYWSRERAFMNLALGGHWFSIRGRWSPLDETRTDRNGAPISLLPGESVALALVRPADSYRADVAIRCHYRGSGVVTGVGMGPARQSPGVIEFNWRTTVEIVYFRIDATDPADPIRAIDCREAGADRRAIFEPAFVDSLRPYAAVRFMDWQSANANEDGDWSKRTLPTSLLQAGPRGVAMEHMVLLANTAKVDPWFVMPWNADATYMENFARYVHANLDPSLTAYVEMGNEIWNLDFPAARQALAEGKRARLGNTDDEARMRRYAQRAVEAFKVWERIFAKEPQRVVRVLSGQNAWSVPFGHALEFEDTIDHVDALSSAVYFGQLVLSGPPQDTTNVSAFFPALVESIDSTLTAARQYKKLADRHGLRFIAYEGGQHATYRGKDATLVGRFNRDRRMGEAYRIYLARWARDFGDLLMLFHSVSPVGPSMHFGLAEYSGQPMNETPKRAAVLDAIAAARH